MSTTSWSRANLTCVFVLVSERVGVGAGERDDMEKGELGMGARYGRCTLGWGNG